MPAPSRSSTRARMHAREGNCIFAISGVHKKGRRRHSLPTSRTHARAWLNVPRACTRGAQQFLESIKRGRNQNFLTHRGRARGRTEFSESIKRGAEALSCCYSRRHRARALPRARHFETHRAGACTRGRARVGAFMASIARAREKRLRPQHDECDRYRARARGVGHE